MDTQELTRRKCRAHSSVTGKPCQAWAIQGGVVCAAHGGRAPQVKRAAAERLKALVDPAIVALHEILTDQKHPQRLGAVKEVLERDGRIGQELTKSEDANLITYEQLEIIVRRRQAERVKGGS